MPFVKAVFFDGDGTLWRISSEKKEECYERMFKVIGEDKKESFFSLLNKVKNCKEPEKRKREYLLSLLGVEKEKISEALKVFWECIARNLERDSYFEKIAERFKDELIFGIFTDEFRENLYLKLGEWRRYFSVIITPEDTGEMKPSVKFYELMMEKTKLKAHEILVVGDSYEKDIKIAEELGMKTVLVENSLKDVYNFLKSRHVILDTNALMYLVTSSYPSISTLKHSPCIFYVTENTLRELERLGRGGGREAVNARMAMQAISKLGCRVLKSRESSVDRELLMLENEGYEIVTYDRELKYKLKAARSLKEVVSL